MLPSKRVECLHRDDGSIVENDSEKSYSINSYFSSVYTIENATNIPMTQSFDLEAPAWKI